MLEQPTSGFLGVKDAPYPFFAQLIWLLINDHGSRRSGLLEELEKEGFRFSRIPDDGLSIDGIPTDEIAFANETCLEGLQRALGKLADGCQLQVASLIVKLYRDEPAENRIGIGREFKNPNKIVLSRGPELMGAELYPL